MGKSFRYAWSTAERRCFDYLVKAAGSLDGGEEVSEAINKQGVNSRGYIGEFPLLAAAPTELVEWFFEINGGGNVHYVQPSERGKVTSRHKEARLEGRFTERSKAQEFAGILEDILPAGQVDGIKDVQQINLTSHISITRETLELGNDLSSGGMIRVWYLRAPMWVVYNVTEQQV